MKVLNKDEAKAISKTIYYGFKHFSFDDHCFYNLEIENRDDREDFIELFDQVLKERLGMSVFHIIKDDWTDPMENKNV